MRPLIALTTVAALLALFPGAGGAHGGGLDANGCHYEGPSYHCHRKARPNPNANAPVKKSRQNVCHGRTSPNYTSIRYFIAYESMEACLGSGGRPFGAG